MEQQQRRLDILKVQRHGKYSSRNKSQSDEGKNVTTKKCKDCDLPHKAGNCRAKEKTCFNYKWDTTQERAPTRGERPKEYNKGRSTLIGATNGGWTTSKLHQTAINQTKAVSWAELLATGFGQDSVWWGEHSLKISGPWLLPLGSDGVEDIFTKD